MCPAKRSCCPHQPVPPPSVHNVTGTDLAALLERRVVARLARLADVPAVVALMDGRCTLAAAGGGNAPIPQVCKEVEQSTYCWQTWRLQCRELVCKPKAVWHRCKFGRFCGAVPVVCEGRCLAAIKLACRDTTPVRCFKRLVELAKVLVENFALREGQRLMALTRGRPADGDGEAAAPTGNTGSTAGRHLHAQVVRALAYVEDHLGDADLSVHQVASKLGSHPDYLAHLFAEQTGERMSHYITAQRVALARKLLADTNWQIKRVAWTCGFTNPNWFSHVFHVHTGVAPGAYRRQARG